MKSLRPLVEEPEARARDYRSPKREQGMTAKVDPEEVRNQFKAWCSRKLSDVAGLVTPVAKKAGRRHWFTEGGDNEIIEDEEYLGNAIRYVLEGQ